MLGSETLVVFNPLRHRTVRMVSVSHGEPLRDIPITERPRVTLKGEKEDRLKELFYSDSPSPSNLHPQFPARLPLNTEQAHAGRALPHQDKPCLGAPGLIHTWNCSFPLPGSDL